MRSSLVLTEDAVLQCEHAGRAANAPSQGLVRVGARRVLVENDPEQRGIARCPHVSATIKPCQRTLRAQQGYSAIVRIDGRAVCLGSLRGVTDGTPPGKAEYFVRDAGQSLVASTA